MATDNSIAYFGLGLMGSALARSAVQAGQKTYVWNRTKDRESVKALVKDGAILVDEPLSALTSCQLVVVCLFDYASVYQVFESVDELESALKDKTIVNWTTGNAEEGPQMNTWMRDHGVGAYFEGAIMHLPHHVGTEDALTFMSGESEEVFSKIEPLLKSTGPLQYLGGDYSAAALYDAALLAGMYSMLGGCITAIALLSKVKPRQPGATRSPTAEIVKKNVVPMIRLTLDAAETAAEYFDKDDWDVFFGSNEVSYHALANVMQSCKSKGVDDRCLQGLQSLFERATVKEGKGATTGLGLIPMYLLHPEK